MSRAHVRLLKKARNKLAAQHDIIYLCHAIGYVDGGNTRATSAIGKELVFDIQRRIAVAYLHEIKEGQHSDLSDREKVLDLLCLLDENPTWHNPTRFSASGHELIPGAGKCPSLNVPYRLRWVDEVLLPHWESTITKKEKDNG